MAARHKAQASGAATGHGAERSADRGGPSFVKFCHDLDPSKWAEITQELSAFATKCSAGEFVGDTSAMLAAALKVRTIRAPDRSTFHAWRRALGSDGVATLGAADGVDLGPHVLGFAARLATELPALFPDGIEQLRQGQAGTVRLTRRGCAALLAASIFNLIPDRRVQSNEVDPSSEGAPAGEKLDLPIFDLSGILDGEPQKCLCFLAYFNYLATAPPEFLAEVVSFSRRVVPDSSAEDWKAATEKLSEVRIEQGRIEDAANCLHADFANAYLGGGVLRGGNVQEEIRFSVCPECIAGMLFCESMELNEAIIIVGTRRYAEPGGYGGSFHCAGACLDPPEGTPADQSGRVGPHIVAFDALMFPGLAQYDDPFILRELIKSHAAFLGDLDEDAAQRPAGVATGNWGCGVFGGDPQLKSLIQWVAASRAGREFVYYPYGDRRVSGLVEVVQAVQERGLDCGGLCHLLMQKKKAHGPNKVFDNIKALCRR